MANLLRISAALICFLIVVFVSLSSSRHQPESTTSGLSGDLYHYCVLDEGKKNAKCEPECATSKYNRTMCISNSFEYSVIVDSNCKHHYYACSYRLELCREKNLKFCGARRRFEFLLCPRDCGKKQFMNEKKKYIPGNYD